MKPKAETVASDKCSNCEGTGFGPVLDDSVAYIACCFCGGTGKVAPLSPEQPTMEQLEKLGEDYDLLKVVGSDGEYIGVYEIPCKKLLPMFETFAHSLTQRIAQLETRLSENNSFSVCEKLERERATKWHWQGRAEKAEERIAELERKLSESQRLK